MAHPDDESVWAGGYLSRNPDTDVICCSVPHADPERCGDFFRACDVLGVRGWIVGGLSQNERLDPEPAKNLVRRYDRIITHNRVGEYGHGAHIQLHHAMKDLGVQMWVFGYGLADGEPVNAEIKKEALSCYTTRPDVWKNQSKRFDLSRECFLEP